MGGLQGKLMTPENQSLYSSSIEATTGFAARAMSWWKTSILDYLSTLPERNTPYDILVVSHGGWIGLTVRTLVNSGKLRVAEGTAIGKCFNTSITQIEFGDNVNGRGALIKYGDISHLITKKVVVDNADEIPPS